MAHLWRDAPSGWTVTLLTGDTSPLHASSALRRVDPGTGSAWMLLASPGSGVLVNGLPVAIGAAVLSDRDEIRLPDGRKLYFSTETLAAIAPYPESGLRGFCPRCRQPLAPGSPVVRCPGCGLYHHAAEELACWTYGPQCAGCSHETSLDAGFQWTPEDL